MQEGKPRFPENFSISVIFATMFSILDAAKAASPAKAGDVGGIGGSDPMSAMSSMGQFNGGTKKDKAMQGMENWFSNAMNR